LSVAAVDIGTNSVRLLVAGPGLHWLERRVRVVRLGEGVDETGRLAEAAITRAVTVLEEYGEAIGRWDVERAEAVATSALRDAENREEFLALAKRALGVQPRVIDGDEEAALAFRGAVAGLAGHPQPFLVVDVGGGSTEFVFGSGVPEYSVSIDIGSVRLTERALPDRPAPHRQLETARRLVGELFEELRLPKRPATVAGVAGSFTSLAAIALGLAEYDPQAVHGARLSAEQLAGLVDRLAAMTVEETAAIPSLDPARAPVLLGGAVVAEEALRRAGATQVVVSESDLLDGVASGLLGI
jgi:exopolyphosphatase/guanosine-5'-triphosphate,3'-diphosphate pyrophosphatase